MGGRGREVGLYEDTPSAQKKPHPSSPPPTPLKPGYLFDNRKKPPKRSCDRGVGDSANFTFKTVRDSPFRGYPGSRSITGSLVQSTHTPSNIGEEVEEVGLNEDTPSAQPNLMNNRGIKIKCHKKHELEVRDVEPDKLDGKCCCTNPH